MADHQGQERVNEEVNSPVSEASDQPEPSVQPEQPAPPHEEAPRQEVQTIYSDLPRLIEHNRWDTARSFGLHTLLWLQFVWTLLCQVGTTTQTITRGVVRSLQSQVYVFFQGSPYPYRVQDYSLSGPGVPPIDWYYDADKKLFMSSAVYNTTTELQTHHFEWLSGQIKYNDLLLQDISEYLQQTKWAGASCPSAAVILSAWSLHSGTVLHLSEGLRLHTINQDASESVIPIRA